ncbi:MAG: hypothetical protein AAF985_05960 [Bacteroidota bacterium]
MFHNFLNLAYNKKYGTNRDRLAIVARQFKGSITGLTADEDQLRQQAFTSSISICFLEKRNDSKRFFAFIRYLLLQQ